MTSYPEEWSKEPYFSQQLLTYLGNKRKLLPLIYNAIIKTGINPEQSSFIDLFTGSGVVSRLAKKMNFKTIIANDWETYSFITQNLYLREDYDSIHDLFQDKGGLEEVLTYLNNLNLKDYHNFYMSRYYAPKDVQKFDLNTERLFYTPENAQRIDAIRETIKQWYPDKKLTDKQKREKDILVALLLYKASIHTNTSGVFKAYYKDFGGYGNHSLKRILSPLILEMPILINSSAQVETFEQDALFLSKNYKSKDKSTIVYLDPPYNIHQYGSNYHILNTIARWDKPDMTSSYKVDGSIKEKAGIRKDWKNSKSSFCSNTGAIQSFRELVQNIQANFILVSYSIDGIIPFEIMLDILLEKGEVDLTMNPYITHRGGKKSASRKNHNIEFVLSVDTAKQFTVLAKKNKLDILSKIHQQVFYTELKGLYNLAPLNQYFIQQEKGQYLWKTNQFIQLSLTPWLEFYSIDGVENLSSNELEELMKDLQNSLCKNKQEEIIQLLEYFHHTKIFQEQYKILQYMIYQLKFLAYRKNQEDFRSLYAQIVVLVEKLEPKVQIKTYKKLEKLYTIFTKRIQPHA